MTLLLRLQAKNQDAFPPLLLFVLNQWIYKNFSLSINPTVQVPVDRPVDPLCNVVRVQLIHGMVLFIMFANAVPAT